MSSTGTGDNELFPFLVAMEKMLAEGLVTVEESQLFMRMPSCSLTAQTVTEELNAKPDWVSDQVIGALFVFIMAV